MTKWLEVNSDTEIQSLQIQKKLLEAISLIKQDSLASLKIQILNVVCWIITARWCNVNNSISQERRFRHSLNSTFAFETQTLSYQWLLSLSRVRSFSAGNAINPIRFTFQWLFSLDGLWIWTFIEARELIDSWLARFWKLADLLKTLYWSFLLHVSSVSPKLQALKILS